jgi:hypothetical protein
MRPAEGLEEAAMQRYALRSGAAVAITLFVPACSGDSPLAPVGPDAAAAGHVAAADYIEVGGAWTLSQTNHLTFPPFVAQLVFGVEPEGQTTVATCQIQGTMELSQEGRTFVSTELNTTAVCKTRGGQTFHPQPATQIAGEIVGRQALRMTHEGLVSCRYDGAAGDVTDGVAGTLRARGHCVVPGHPKSGIPGFDPPPAGTEIITSWTAERQ